MSDTAQAPAKKRGGWTPEARAKAQATIAAKRAAAPKAAAQPPAPADEFPGLTAADCAKGCSPKSCVISGKSYCAHPRKGGLQGPDMHNRAAVDRLNAAKKMLGHQVVEARD